ncbi:MAG: beta-ketoacyl-[acyl-carrier-protein] synthase family protein [Desulfovermiculus sp.]
MKSDVTPVVLGYDAVSPLGLDLEAQWEKALQGRSGIGPLTRFPVDPTFPVHIAGEVEEIQNTALSFLKPRALALWPSPIFKYALLVVHRALARSHVHISADIAHRIAVTFSTAVGGQDAVLHADRRMQREGKLPPPYSNPNSCINMVGGKISMLTGATGPITSSITACATGVSSMITGAMLLAQGRADVAICGAVDFALVEPIVAGFATMNGTFRAKPGEEQVSPECASRPFSHHRRGFVISEGAGAIILATREFANTHGLSPKLSVAGWGMTSDAHHYVAPHLKTVSRCMQEAISDAGLNPRDVDAVNAHAASTKVGDRVEAQALEAVFEGDPPPVTANKSQLGHAMGASSALESILAMQGMVDACLPPTLNYQADPELALDCVPEGARSLEQEFVLKNAFGFGGCNACIVLQKIG